MIFVNFKTYRESSGELALTLSKTCEEVSQEMNIPIIPIVSALDLCFVKKEIVNPVWIQHVDPQDQGASTGSINIESAFEDGAAGTLLNHSEYPLDFATLSETVKGIKEFQNAFQVMICCRNIEVLNQVKTLKPDFLAYEPPELIGSLTSSVASEKSDIIKEAVENADKIPLIVGAGIKSKEDVRISLEKGAKGILLSSAVVLAKDPKQVLRELAEGFRR